MQSNTRKGVISDNSAYALSKDIIEKNIQGEEIGKHQIEREVYAKKVVKHLLSRHPSDQLFVGDSSTTLWFLDTFTWHGIWVSNISDQEIRSALTWKEINLLSHVWFKYHRG
jgi:hypothetical protein